MTTPFSITTATKSLTLREAEIICVALTSYQDQLGETIARFPREYDAKTLSVTQEAEVFFQRVERLRERFSEIRDELLAGTEYPG